MCICDEDAHRLNIVFKEAIRLDMPIAWYADRCSQETVDKLKGFDLTVGIYRGSGQFSEVVRQHAFDMLDRKGFGWALNWDSDETWSKTAKKDMEKSLGEYERAIVCPMKTVWEKDNELYFREDGLCHGTQSNTKRIRLYSLDFEWMWQDKAINGPAYMVGRQWVYPDINKLRTCNATTIHWGYADDKMRESHKKRWDKIYTEAVGRQPYNNWEWFCDKTIEPTLTPYTEI